MRRSADTKGRGRFSEMRRGPSHHRARSASAALENFVRRLQKTFSTESVNNGSHGPENGTFAVGTRVTPRPPHRSVRAQFGHTACMGLSLSRWRHAILVVLCIPFFCSTRAASILPSRPHISIAVARSGGQGRRFFSAAEGLSLTDASTAAGCRRSGGWQRHDPRGACHWPRSIARTTLVFG